MREDLFTSRSSAYPVISHECMSESRDCRFRVEGVDWFKYTAHTVLMMLNVQTGGKDHLPGAADSKYAYRLALHELYGTREK